MKLYIVLNVFLRLYHLTDALNVDYCQLPCHIKNKTVEHIMCTLKNDCSVGPECKVKTKFDYNPDLKSFTLDMHNYFRNKVAFGEALGQHKGNLPQAADMLEMVWDEELAHFAQCYANKCILQYDKCRQSSEAQDIGQLIFIRVSVNPKSVEETITEMVEYVFHSSKSMTLEDIEKYKDNKYTRQFAQLVWARTNKVGCGMTRLLEDVYAFFMVCNYGPAGNIEGAKVYNVGLTCSSCPDNRKCGIKYFGLCAATEDEKRIFKERAEVLRALEQMINTDNENPVENYEVSTNQTGTEIQLILEDTNDTSVSKNITTSTSRHVDVSASDTSNEDITIDQGVQEIEYFSTKQKGAEFPFDKLFNEIESETSSTMAMLYKEVPMRKCMVERKYNWPDLGNQDSGAYTEQMSLSFTSIYVFLVKII